MEAYECIARVYYACIFTAILFVRPTGAVRYAVTPIFDREGLAVITVEEMGTWNKKYYFKITSNLYFTHTHTHSLPTAKKVVQFNLLCVNVRTMVFASKVDQC